MARIDVKLSSKDIRACIKKLKNLRDNIDKVADEIAQELAQQTAKQIDNNYRSLWFAGMSNSGKPLIGFEKYSNGWRAFARGGSVFYDEFGTGDRGASDGHPLKGSFGLRPYNSGRTIRKANKSSAEHGITSGLYWTYKDIAGNIVYTNGVPSGKFMYNASIWLRKNYKKIAKEKVDDVLSKL